MDVHSKSVAEMCIRGSEDDSLNFPTQLARLAQVGFEGYYTDFRRSARIFYRPDGESLELATAPVGVPVSLAFDAPSVGAAVRQSQAGHTPTRIFAGRSCPRAVPATWCRSPAAASSISAAPAKPMWSISRPRPEAFGPPKSADVALRDKPIGAAAGWA